MCSWQSSLTDFTPLPDPGIRLSYLFFHLVEILEKELPVLEPDQEKLRHPPGGQIQATWLGHASVLVQFDGNSFIHCVSSQKGWNILADPIFSERCSPFQFAGPRRFRYALSCAESYFRPAPLQTDALPRIDIVVISHNHYDHLDEITVKQLAARKSPPMFFVPLGTFFSQSLQ